MRENAHPWYKKSGLPKGVDRGDKCFSSKRPRELKRAGHEMTFHLWDGIKVSPKDEGPLWHKGKREGSDGAIVLVAYYVADPSEESPQVRLCRPDTPCTPSLIYVFNIRNTNVQIFLLVWSAVNGYRSVKIEDAVESDGDPVVECAELPKLSPEALLTTMEGLHGKPSCISMYCVDHSTPKLK